MRETLTNSMKFWFGDLIYHRLTGMRGIILSIQYESPEFYHYAVIYEDGRIDRTKEEELLTKDEYDTERIITND